MAGVSISDQIRCVEREIKKREYVYPRQVAQGKMSQNRADAELDRMRAVLATLNEVAETQAFELTP